MTVIWQVLYIFTNNQASVADFLHVLAQIMKVFIIIGVSFSENQCISLDLRAKLLVTVQIVHNRTNTFAYT